MITSTSDRQTSLALIITEALKDSNLTEALAAYGMGQAEYERAITASTTVIKTTGNSSNLTESPDAYNANMD